MASLKILAIASIIIATSAGASAQTYYQPTQDPCQPGNQGGLLGVLVGSMNAQQRAQACAAERKAQWDDYYAKQAAEKERHDDK